MMFDNDPRWEISNKNFEVQKKFAKQFDLIKVRNLVFTILGHDGRKRCIQMQSWFQECSMQCDMILKTMMHFFIGLITLSIPVLLGCSI